MTLDWNAFTPWPALAGGVLIGIASGALINSGFRTYGKVLTWSSGLVVAIVVAMMISRRERRSRR